MKKLVLVLGLFFMSIAFGQVKKVELTNEEINILAQRFYSYRGNMFKANEIKKLKLKNTIDFFLEFQFEDKVIQSKIVKLKNHIGQGYSNYYLESSNIHICFDTQFFSNEFIFEFLKEGWNLMKVSDNENYICSDWNKGDVKLFQKTNDNKYIMNSLLNGKIKMVLYRLEN